MATKDTNEVSNFIQNGKFEDFTLYSGFKIGYRSREDKTMLPPGVLIPGSQNVLTNTYQRVGPRKGYTLDGQSNSTLAGVVSNYDWDMRAGQRIVRYIEPTTSGGSDGVLQYRYVDSAGTVTWRDLLTGLSTTSINFTTFWDFNTEKKDFLLFVDGTSYIREWTGGIATFLSATANTITVEGTTPVANLNFYNLTPWGSVTINGTDYAYTGVSGQTFTGVTPDPSLAGYSVGEPIHQKVKTTANSSLTGLPATFPNALIGTLRNQVYVGALTDNTVYISKTNNYKDYGYTTPVRVVGEGATVTLDAAPTALIPQEDRMYVSAGIDQWYETKFTLSGDLTSESFEINRLKTSVLDAAQSQALSGKMDNSVIFVSNVAAVTSLGRVDNVVLTPQFTDLSFTIVNDMNGYDFTGGHIIYHKKYIYVSVPLSSVVLVYNMTNPSNPYWEAPQVLPVARFSIINGELYGHSFTTPETYKLFDGYSDNGAPILTRARFSYSNYGSRSQTKGFGLWCTEGYISANTTLTMNLNFEVDGCQTTQTYNLVGTNTRFVCLSTDDNSLGKNPLGSEPLGGFLSDPVADPTPPKFRWIKSFPIKYFYEQSVEYTSYGADYQWYILTFGPQLVTASDLNTNITD